MKEQFNTTHAAPLHHTQRRERYTLDIHDFAIKPAYHFAVFMGVFGVGAMAILVGWLWQLPTLIVSGGGFVFFGASGAAMVWFRLDEYRPLEDTEETEFAGQPVAPPPSKLQTTIALPDGTAIIARQPRAGELATWLKLVLDRDSGVTFSQRTAVKRGWNIENYQNLLEQMATAGLMGQGGNRVPEPTDKGRDVLTGWVNYRTPHPKQ